jgi:hypothetical protein
MQHLQIDQDGLSAPPLSSRNWGTAKVLKNLYWESSIPKSLAPGNYLVRHELLALHQAKTPQFYAECAQVGCNTPLLMHVVLTHYRSRSPGVVQRSQVASS